MNTGDGKKTSTIAEQIFDVVCLIASYGILFLLPHKTDIFFYLIFGVSAFLFCIGFFRMGFLFSTPADSRGTLLTGLFFIVFGAVINAVGLYGICQDQGSGRSIFIATLLLIEALLFYAIAGSSAEAPGTRWRISILFRAAAVLIVLFGIAFAVKNGFSELSVIVGTMILIEAVCLWAMSRGNNPFNTFSSEIRTVPGMKTPIEQLSRDLADVETQLGYPWIGRIKTIRENCIIYGPADDGFYVFGYYHFGRFYMAGSENPLFPDPEDAQRHLVQEIPDQRGILLPRESLPEAYVNMFNMYKETGSARWITEL